MNYFFHKTIFNKSTGLKYLLFVGLLCLSQITSAQIYNTQDISGSLNNNFDADRVQSEIDLQVEVTQEFSRNLQDLNHRQNQRKDDLKAQLERNEITQQYYNEQVAIIERQNLMVNMIAGGLMSPSDSVLGIATSTVSPAVSYAVGQHFKKEGKEGSFEHIATHAVIGALTSAANGGNALSGAVSAGGAEHIAKVTAETLFQKDANELTADEKQTVSTISQLVGTISGSVMGDSSLDAYVGGTVATNAVDNNYLGYFGKNNIRDFTKDLAKYCGANGNSERCAATYNRYKEISYKQGGLNPQDTQWEEFVAATYQKDVLPLCKGNRNCEMTVIQDMKINLVLYAGAPGTFREAIAESKIATNIVNGNWIRLGVNAFGDLTLLTGVRGFVNPNSAYVKLMDSVTTVPSKTGISSPTRQIGAVDIKGMVTSQKIAHDLVDKGVHFNVGKVELRALPDNNGGIIFKPAFSQRYTTKEINAAISQANKALENKTFKNFLIKHAEKGFNMAKQEGKLEKANEFKIILETVKRMNNNKK